MHMMEEVGKGTKDGIGSRPWLNCMSGPILFNLEG